jgi:hypothetical protein
VKLLHSEKWNNSRFVPNIRIFLSSGKKQTKMKKILLLDINLDLKLFFSNVLTAAMVITIKGIGHDYK